MSVSKGLEYLSKGDLDRAHKFLSKAFDDSAEANLNMSAVLVRLNKHALALKHARRALELREGWALAISNIGMIYHHMGNSTLAIEWLERAYALGYADAGFNAALDYLRLDINSARGWELFELRFDRSSPVKRSDRPAYLQRWDGVSSGRVLVQAEQGYGDLFNFSSYEGDLLYQAFAGTENVLRGLGVNVITDAMEASDCKWWIPQMSLPGILGPLRVKGSGMTGGGGLGLCWKGYSGHVNDRNRSSTEAMFKRMFGRGRSLVFSGVTWEHTFLSVASCDFIVTVDTSIAHVAGRLGVPTIVLIPAYDTDWRWGVARDGLHENLWYENMWLVADMNFALAKEILHANYKP